MLTRSRYNKMADTQTLLNKIEEIRNDLGSRIDNLVKALEEKDKTIINLETKVALLETRCNLLERRLDDSEQYTRRSSLRINGIPSSSNETAKDCLDKVKGEVAKLGIQVQDCEFDRAHRIGPTVDREGKPIKDRQMIVRFSTFRARTAVYRNRKNGNKDVRYYIDQTKRRFELRKMAVKHCEDKLDVDFVFVDVNCNLCIRLKNGKFEFFNSNELINLVGT